MARIFITGSTDGLGLAAAHCLINDGQQVVLHARSRDRARVFDDLAPKAAGIVLGDLSSAAETRSVTEQVNAIGPMDSVIHNAGVYRVPGRMPTVDGHATTLAVNVLAPYMLTALMTRPRRLIYMSSAMHRSGVASLDDIDWIERPWNTTQAYSDSKLFDATLAFAIARRWPDVLSNAVTPGWVATKMGGASAPDDFDEGYLTQTWLAASDDAAAMISGKYLYHRKVEAPEKAVGDVKFQDALLAKLREITGVTLQ